MRSSNLLQAHSPQPNKAFNNVMSSHRHALTSFSDEKSHCQEDRTRYTLHLHHIICCQGPQVDWCACTKSTFHYYYRNYTLNTHNKLSTVHHCQLTLASLTLCRIIDIASLCIVIIWQCGQISLLCVRVCMCVCHGMCACLWCVGMCVGRWVACCLTILFNSTFHTHAQPYTT